MSKLYDYIFHYNHYTELWYAIPRYSYTKYWDNDNSEGILKSKNISTLIEIITKEIKL